jgi:hypothetical protein
MKRIRFKAVMFGFTVTVMEGAPYPGAGANSDPGAEL